MKVKKNTQSFKTITSNTREQGRGSMKNCWARRAGPQRSAWLCSNYSFVRRRPRTFDPSGQRCFDATTDYEMV